MVAAGLLFLVPAFQSDLSYPEENPFFSIHLASFKDLQSAGKYINDLGSREKIVFWKEMDVPGKGTCYRVYTGQYNSRKEWKNLIDTSKECPALVEPNPFNNVIVHVRYWSRKAYAHGRDTISTDLCPKSYAVNLYYGTIQNRNENEGANILPVRNFR